MSRAQTLRCRIKLLTVLFIAGLVVSGATAIPLRSEVDFLANSFGYPTRLQPSPNGSSTCATDSIPRKLNSRSYFTAPTGWLSAILS
jgi:hypothetical protein